jgi:hypothetical protein
MLQRVDKRYHTDSGADIEPAYIDLEKIAYLELLSRGGAGAVRVHLVGGSHLDVEGKLDELAEKWEKRRIDARLLVNL